MNVKKDKNIITPKVSDLGQDRIYKLLLKFSIPAIISMILTSLYNVVDAIFLGHAYTDGTGIAVTTIALPIHMLLLGFMLLPGQGGNALAAIKLGKGDQESVERTLGNALILMILGGAIIALAGVILIDPILGILGTPDSLIDETKDFVQIQMFGFVFFSVGAGLSNFIRSAGRPNYSLMVNAISVFSCIVFNAIFVYGLKMGVRGSALATVAGQSLGAIAAVAFFICSKHSSFKLHVWAMKPDTALMLRILIMGLASFAMNFAAAVICIVFN